MGSSHGDTPKYAGEGVASHGPPGDPGGPCPRFAADLGNFVLTHLRHAASEAHHLIFGCYIIWGCCDVMCDVTVPHCINHMTFCYKRSTDILFEALLAFGSSSLPLPPVSGRCLMHVGHNTSSASSGRSLLPSNVIIVLALVNSATSPERT